MVDHLCERFWNLGGSPEAAREVYRPLGCAVVGVSDVLMDVSEEIVEWELRLNSEAVRPLMVGPEKLYARDDEYSHHGHHWLRTRQTLAVVDDCYRLKFENWLALQGYGEAPQAF